MNITKVVNENYSSRRKQTPLYETISDTLLKIALASYNIFTAIQYGEAMETAQKHYETFTFIDVEEDELENEI